MVKVGGYILGEFGNLIAGDPRSGCALAGCSLCNACDCSLTMMMMVMMTVMMQLFRRLRNVAGVTTRRS